MTPWLNTLAEVDVETSVTGIAAGGDGLARLDDGRVLLCSGGLPGERVRAEITSQRRDYARGRVIEVLDASPHRVAPPCPHVAAGCGGCTWQYVEPLAQVGLKARIVTDSLRRLARVPSPPVTEGWAVPAEAYRTSVRLGVDRDGRPGYRRRATHELIGVDSCLVSHPALERLITTSRFPGATEVLLRVSAGTGERLASPDRGAARAVVDPDVQVSRHGSVHENAAGRRWRVSAGSFFQSGPAAVEVIVDAVDATLGPIDGTLVDLYAGVGVIGGSLAARRAVRLIAVESGRAAARDAVANLADLDATVLHREVATYAHRGAAGAVVADPSRSGLGPGAAEAVARIGAPTVVLVSCDPASLARDTGLLAGHGYRLEDVLVLDLFPGTFHVETVARFSSSDGPRPL